MVGLQIEWVAWIAMTWCGPQISVGCNSDVGLQIGVQINLVVGLLIDLCSNGSTLIYGGHGFCLVFFEILWGGLPSFVCYWVLWVANLRGLLDCLGFAPD